MPIDSTRETPAAPPLAGPAAGVVRFLQTLRDRLAQTPHSADIVDSLTLAIAAVHSPHPLDPPHVAILGPTQAGKSTLVNVLLGQPAADVSPLAGFTVHPQAFVCDREGNPAPDLESWFPNRSCVEPALLDRENLAQFALASVAGPPTGWSGPERFVVWDTPDFDSLASPAYRSSVLEIAARTDVHLIVLSKEKYADLAVWRLLSMLAPLARPMLICVNKVSADARDAIETSLRARLAGVWPDAAATTIELMFAPYDPALAENANHPFARELRARLSAHMTRTARCNRRAGIRALTARYRSAWLAPLQAEHDAQATWRGHVDNAVETALAAYQTEYLDHPQRFEAFRGAMRELLRLLEIPATADALGRLRHVLTWPARQLFEWRAARPKDVRVRGGNHALVLDSAFDRLLARLRGDALGASPGEPVASLWSAIGAALATRESALKERFLAAGDAQQESFRVHERRAAEGLFEALKQRPAILTALRAARLGADVTAIAVAIKTGGLAPEGFILAPALVGVVSMLTEAALGSYMTKVAAQLRQEQARAVREQVFDAAVRPVLHDLAAGATGPGVIGIPPEALRDFEADCQAWQDQHD